MYDGGFELGLTAGPGTYVQNQASYGAWTAIGNPALLGMPYAALATDEGAEAVHVGNNAASGGVKQTLATAVGQKYWLALGIIGWPGLGGTIRATVYGPGRTNLLQDIVAPASNVGGVASYSFFASNATTTLQIQNMAGAATIDAVRVSTPPLDMALKFDGLNDYVTITNFGNRMPTNEVTVEFWQRVRSAGAHAPFILSPAQLNNSFSA